MWTLHEAKNRFSALVEAALAGQPQRVSRRGKPAVVVLAEGEYRALVAAARADRPGFAEHLLAFPQGGELPRAAAAPRDAAL